MGANGKEEEDKPAMKYRFCLDIFLGRPGHDREDDGIGSCFEEGTGPQGARRGGQKEGCQNDDEAGNADPKGDPPEPLIEIL